VDEKSHNSKAKKQRVYISMKVVSAFSFAEQKSDGDLKMGISLRILAARIIHQNAV
jgi:hypothetical protein